MGKFEDLVKQIDAFIRKYYKNLMLKGVLLFFSIFLFTFLIITSLEFIGRFNSLIRAFLLFSFIGLNTYVLIKYFLIPTSKLFSFGKRIDRFQAAEIIGKFFPNVDDRLLNTLQLQDTSQSHPQNIELIQASIEQNSKKLNSFKFSDAIDLTNNKRFLKYFLPILLTVVLIGVFFPHLFSVGSERIINYNEVFARTPDFTFQLENKLLTVQEGEDLKLELKVIPTHGNTLPDRIYLVSDEGTFLMTKKSIDQATYTFDNLTKDVQFHFKALNDNSGSINISVVKRTSLGHLKVDIKYPNYLNRSNETIENPGDLVLPYGTELVWNGTSKNTKSLSVLLPDTTFNFGKGSGFRFTHKVYQSSDVLFVLENNQIDKMDSLSHHIDVINDEYPKISAQELKDSLDGNRVFFKGEASDDYGLSSVTFTYKIQKDSGDPITKSIQVPGIIVKSSPFSMSFNLNQLGLELNDKVTYFFTVYDNDGIRGPKATRSRVFQFFSPSLEELHKQRSEEKDESLKDLNDLIKKSEKFKESIKSLKDDILNSKDISWQQQKQIGELQNQNSELQKQIDKLKEKLKSSFEKKEQLSPDDKKLNELQKEVEKMLDNLMDKELQDLLKDLQKMLENNNRDELLPKLEDSQLSAEEKEKLLEHTKEMLKTFDVEERVDDLEKSLTKLAEEQDALKEEMKDGMDKDKALSKQEELNKKFDQVKKDLEEMLKRNEDLKRPLSFDGIEELADDISKEMEGAKENIEDNKGSQAEDKQKKASDKMQEAASQLQAQMAESKDEQEEEDYKSMRLLLENLIRLSFNQEDNMEAFDITGIYDPKFISLGKEQRGIIDNLRPVKDSLRALAERNPKIASYIEQELTLIDKQYRYIPTHIDEREKRLLSTKQQFAMTGINNLALFMNESLESAQMQMRGNKSGEGDCDTPGGEGKPGEKGSGKGKSGKNGEGQMESIKEMLKKQLEQLKSGSQPGGQKPGSKPGGLLPMGSQQAAKMAAQQNAIQQQLEELRQQLNKDGSGAGNQLNKLIEELEKQQNDLIQKDWNSQLIDRQQDILTRLLESDKAIRERGLDDARKSNSGKNTDFSNQIEFSEYKKQKEKQIELLRTLDPSFNEYYKEKANAYFINLK